MTRLITPVELRGLEPLTPTLPGAGRRSNQARSAANGRVGGVAGTAIVVTVVVRRSSARGAKQKDSHRPGLNAGWLLALNIWVVVAGIRRLVSGAPDVHGLPVLVVSAAAAVVMLVGALVVRGDLDNDDGGQDLNMKAVLLDTAADAAAAGGVAASGAVIMLTGGWYWLDPTVALVIAAVVGYHAVVLIWRVLRAVRTRPRPIGDACSGQ